MYDTFTDSGESESERLDAEANEPSTTKIAYSTFSISQKRLVVFLTAFTSLFSPLSSFIYYPAITFIAQDLDISLEMINLTITSYTLISGIAPALLGDMADTLGRRPIYIGMMAVYIGANIALALQHSYAALVILRMVQSFGSSATIAIAYGVIGDIASPAERGSYAGYVMCGPNLSPVIGPIIGGAIVQIFGWRAIFWLLAILSSFCFTLLLFLFPETSRNIVGNGSITASGLNRTLMSFLSPRKGLNPKAADLVERKRKISLPNPVASIYTIFQKDVGLIMVVHGTFYMTYSCVHASLASLLIDIYRLSGVQAGLLYLPCGLGCLLSSYFTGKVLNRDYRLTSKAHNFVIDELRGDNLSNFPIEKARLRSVPYLIALCAVSITGYGWSVDREMNILVPLTLQFFFGVTIVLVFNALQTLLVDLHPDSPATAQAGLNLVRCAFSACGLAALQLIIDAVGPGRCFTLFAGICLGTLPLVWMESKWGIEWRLAKGNIACEEEELLLPVGS